MFLDKKIGMYLSGRWMYPKIEEKANFNWYIAPFPAGNSPQICDASGWAITKQTKNEDLAYKFIQYLASDKNMKYFTETGLIVPANKISAEILNNKRHNEYVFLEVLKNSKSIIIPKDYKKLVDKFNAENF
jgi:ABC-type glycerol-3-phosphate transport system substrate-binding protein